MLYTDEVEPRPDLLSGKYQIAAHQKSDGSWQAYWEKDEKPDIAETHNTDTSRFRDRHAALQHAASMVSMYFAGE